MHRTGIALCTLALSSALAAPALAQTSEPGSTLPPAQQYESISVVNGGVDLGEAELFKRSSQYPLRVVFSVKSGDYAVADELAVKKDGQVVAEIPSAGPWLLMDMPPGRYTLQARFDDKVVEKPVTVGRAQGPTTVHWTAPASVN